MMQHREIAKWVAKIYHQAGWDTKAEVVVPEWAERKAPPAGAIAPGREVYKDAVIDVVCFRPLHPTHYVDITVRCPTASRYARQAQVVPGHSLLLAEKEKAKR